MKGHRFKRRRIKNFGMQSSRKLFIAAAGAALLFAGCANPNAQKQPKPENFQAESSQIENAAKTGEKPDTQVQQNPVGDTALEQGSQESPSLINPDGMTLAERFRVPDGFVRRKAKAGSLLEFLRNYPLKEDGSPVLLYDKTLKASQSSHAAVLKLPVEQEDLQQCADSVIRVYAEYFWQTGQYGRIAFHFVNGFYAEYTKWRDGFRIRVDGNEAAWEKVSGYDDSYENFQKYLRIVFAYAGTLSMEAETKAIAFGQIRAGDILIRGASPGHVVMVVDVCKDANGKKAFLLAQGYMPAQEFHVLKNPLHEDDPWYYEQEAGYPFQTPEYTFLEGSLRRLDYE